METQRVPGKDSSEAPGLDWTSPQRPSAWGRQLSEGEGLHQPHALALSLVQLEDDSWRMDGYLRQSLPYLQSPQQPLRLEAVRFIGEPEPRGPSVPEGRRAGGPAGRASVGGELCCWEGLAGRVCDRLCAPRAHWEASGGLARGGAPHHLRR